MQKGTIKTIIAEKGFGFISREGETKDLFFYKDSVRGVGFDELKVGDTVSFDVIQGAKGPAADNVTRE